MEYSIEASDILERGLLPDNAWFPYAMQIRRGAEDRGDMAFVAEIDAVLLRAGWKKSTSPYYDWEYV